MCRTDVDPRAQQALASVLNDMASALAAESGVDRDNVLIGPVDFGDEPPVSAALRREGSGG